MTVPLAGKFVHYVFRDKDSELFTMTHDLFKCRDSRLKITEIIRREQMLDFGDCIRYTANERNEIIDYEKDLAVYETDCIEGYYLVSLFVCFY